MRGVPHRAAGPALSESGHWFEPVAEHLGAAYLRYSFTKGTVREVDRLVEVLDLVPGSRVLDVGCGPGRHAHELARRGVTVVGIDRSERFVRLAAASAPPGSAFARADAAALPFPPVFDAVISLCQGAFGLAGGPVAGEPVAGGDPDGAILVAMARCLRPGGRLALSAFSAYFQLRFLEDSDAFDAEKGVNHERTTVRSEEGTEAEVELWTSCFTPRELRLLAVGAGLEVRGLWSVTPGDYSARPPDLDHPEFLLVAERSR